MSDTPKVYPSVDLALLCDDIRTELFRKVTFVGVYTGDTILTTTVPLRLAKLCFYQRLRGGKGQFHIHFKIEDPLGNEVLKASVEDFQIESEDQMVDLHLIFGNVRLEMEGSYVAQIFFDSDRKIGSFQFRVLKGEPKPV